MKRMIAMLVLALFLGASTTVLVGCGGSKETKKAETTKADDTAKKDTSTEKK